MNPVDLIVKKRDGGTLSAEDIRAFINGYVADDVPDYQAAAFAMAVYFQGMDAAETTALTMAMAESGDQLDLHDAVPPGAIIVDKHSSGGVGDKTTLAVGPIVAACGLPVGKMSGRGLSFSGGTIDKLESIPGWSPDLSETAFRRQLQEIGLVVAGQTADLAPADKKLYALRDVTGTVPSLPLIAASIMSKKLAAGADAIVLDVKCGRGAFMETLEEARALAKLMVEIGARAGRQVTALITQMSQPLGNAIGNALEVQEAIATLHGDGPADFQILVQAVAVEMLRLGRPQEMTDEAVALDQVRAVIASGAALAKLRAFIAAQGGDAVFVDHPEQLPAAPVIEPVIAPFGGFIRALDARELGLTAVALGGGRAKKGDTIDHRVGIVLDAKIGNEVAPGDRLATVHAATQAQAEQACMRVLSAYTLAEEAVPAPIIVLDRISSQDS
ncbi:MAG: thymidine phosphorylase [Caldilineaceae bacterium]|nr:thymidine phosphorylase [Caldilineaceae bacterium]